MFNLTLYPAKVEIIAKPNAVITQAFEVTNNSDSIISLIPEILPWLPQGPDGSVTYDQVPTSANFSFSIVNPDLKLGQSFILKPQEKKQIVIKLKSSSVSDGYFTFFLSQNDIQTNSLQNNSYLSGKIGSHLLIATSETENLTSTFTTTKLSLNPKLKDIFFTPINLSAQVINTSDHYATHSSPIIITKNNQLIQKIDTYPTTILAHESRQIQCFNQTSPVNCQLQPPFWPGLYTITLNDKSTNYFVFPFSLVITIVFAILFWLLVRFRLSRR